MSSWDLLSKTLASIGPHSGSMEEMEVDQVVDIPDTPDRLPRRHIGRMHPEQGSRSSAVGCSRNSEYQDNGYSNWLRSTGMLVSERGHNRRNHLHLQKDSVIDDAIKPHRDLTTSSLLESNPSSICPLFRKASFNIPKSEVVRCNAGHHKDNGKLICGRPSEKQPVWIDDNDSLETDEWKLLEIVLPTDESKNFVAGDVRDGRVLLNCGGSDATKGKQIADLGSSNGIWSALNSGKNIDLGAGCQHKVSRPMPEAEVSVTLPRVNGNKKLVRNGCISPTNIVLRAQRLADNHHSNSTDGETNQVTSMMDIREIVAKDEKRNSAKGKRVIIHPSTSKAQDTEQNSFPSSTSSVRSGDRANENNGLGTNAMVGGWRSMCNCDRIGHQSLSDIDDHSQQRHDVFGIGSFGDSVAEKGGQNRTFTKDAHNLDGRDGFQTASSPFFDDMPIHERNLLHVANRMRKRRREQNSGNCGQSSASISNGDSEVIFLGSSRESSSPGLSGIQKNQHNSNLVPISEIDELSTEMRNSNSQGTGLSGNVDSDDRARQMEADERLARELQEQLYNEVPMYGGSEIDESVTWVLQQAENTVPAVSSPDQPFLHRRALSRTSSYRQHQPPSFNNPSNRRTSQAIAPSIRAPQLRSHLFNRSTTALSRNRNSSSPALSRRGNVDFPLSMDLDMRLDILEALEAAVGGLNDLSITSTGPSMEVSHMLQIDRDFNENDYEMLSSLDECNLLNTGISANLIRNLPESVVQSDNFDQTCAICLETPTTGETIRHLPCMHKFHKDCIDMWLHRKRSCPICKSSIS